MKGEEIFLKLTCKGKSHKEHGKKNQDSIIVKKIGKDKTIIIAGDGVSSCEKGGEASKLVTQCFYKIIKEELLKCKDSEKIKDIFYNTAEATLHCLKKAVFLNGKDLREWGTTLEVALYWGKVVYYFHCGDGAIISLRNDGFIEQTNTENHKGETSHSVVPFSEKYSWEYGIFENSLGVVVMTDGVYELIRPINIRKYGYEYEPSLFLPVIDRRCHNNSKNNHYKYINQLFNGVVSDDETVEKLRELLAFLDLKDERKNLEQGLEKVVDNQIASKIQKRIRDDMTLGAYFKQYPVFYQDMYEPDYEMIRELDYRKAYPHLYT